MKNLVHESWKRQRDDIAHELTQPAFLNMTVKLLTYWWWFERVFLRKIYSHLPHATLVRCCAHKHRQMSHFSLPVDVVFHPSFMPMDGNVMRDSSASSQKCTSPVPLSPVLRSNVFQPWRILFQITSYNTLTSKSNRMRLCECVTFSQNSCMCNGIRMCRFQTESWSSWLRSSLSGTNGGEIEQMCLAGVRCLSDAVNGFLHPLPPFTDG